MAIQCWCSKIFSKQCGDTFGISQNPCWYHGKMKWEWVKTCQNPGSPVFPRDVQPTVSSPHSKGAIGPIGFDPSNKSCHCKNSSVSWNFNSRVRRSSCLLLERSQLQLKVSGWNLFAFRFFCFYSTNVQSPGLGGPSILPRPSRRCMSLYEYANVEFEALQHCRFLHLLPKTGS